MNRAEAVRQLDEALNALDWAVQALCLTHPDVSDYVHTQGAEAYVQAKREHDARVQKLLDVRKELNTMANRLEAA